MMIMFRTDGNPTLGMGHVMRCLSLAKALRHLNCECVFSVSDSACISEIKNNQFEVYDLNAQWNDYDSSIDVFVQLIQSLHPHLIVIDSYFYSDSFVKTICRQTKVAIITECCPADFPTDVDYFINYNAYLNKFCPHFHSGNTRYILGSKYALLRTEFEALPQRSRKSKNNLAILTGGSDPYNIACKLSERIINDERFSAVAVNIISGKLNPNISNLLELEKKSKQISVIISPSNMREEMQKNAVACSAGGSTLYELCACAIPCVSFSYADNQLSIVKYFDDVMLIPYAGDIRTNYLETMEYILERLHELLCDNIPSDSIGKRMRELCDGKGARRVASILTSIL